MEEEKGKKSTKDKQKQYDQHETSNNYGDSSYVWGPIEVPTYSGNKHFITFVDEYSKMLWLCLIKSKSNALEIYKEFKALVENTICLYQEDKNSSS